jgi:hypothetical protein
MAKPDCYKCIYRGELAGDAHSCCKHPKVIEAEKTNGADLIGLLALLGVGVMANIKGIKVKGNNHGIKHGWFAWPFNFDPVWLEECDGFKEKEKKV